MQYNTEIKITLKLHNAADSFTLLSIIRVWFELQVL